MLIHAYCEGQRRFSAAELNLWSRIFRSGSFDVATERFDLGFSRRPSVPTRVVECTSGQRRDLNVIADMQGRPSRAGAFNMKGFGGNFPFAVDLEEGQVIDEHVLMDSNPYFCQSLIG